MANNRSVSVGVKFDGDAKGYVAAAEKAKKTTQQLKKEQEFKTQQKSLDNFIGSLKAMAVTYVSIQAAQKVFTTGMNQTGEGAFELEKVMTQVNKGFETFAGLLVSGDFTNGIEKIRDAVRAAKELAEAMDMSNERLEALDVYKAATDSKVKMLRVKEAEGTITKAEQATLKTLLGEQLSIEKDIYEKRTEAYIEFIAKRNGLNEDLFKNIESGIIDIAKTEEGALDKITTNAVANYKQFRDQFIKDNTQIQSFQPSGDAMPITINKPPSASAVGSAMSGYLAGKGTMEQAILVREMLSNEEEWKGLLDNMVKRNALEGEYARNLKITSKELKNQKETLEIPNIELAIKDKFTDAFDFDIAEGFDTSALDKELADIIALPDYDKLTNGLESAFNGMFQAGLDGWESFGDAAISTMKRITAELAAKAALWMLLNILTGGKATEGMKLGEYLFGFKGIGKAVGGAAVGATGDNMLKGRDIYLAGNRYGQTLIKNT